MIAYKFNSLCQQAEQYYYDFLCSESNEPVPEFIINHINQCLYCNEQISKLKDTLSLVKDYIESGQDQISIATAAWLRLHFAYIGKRVTCETVKPFLPGFLEPALEIKIPTPITAHLDNCQQCRQDLKTILELNLNSKQLCRLSQLFTEKVANDTINCLQAQTAIANVVSMNFNEVDKEALKHLCVCPDCLIKLYQHRETVRDKFLNIRNKKEPKMFLCQEISASDYFDCVIPYGLDPAADQYAKFRSFFTSHSSTCPICLTKMQQLHRTIFEIAERANSEIVTIYHIEEPAETAGISEADDIYAGFPIKVEITRHEDKTKVEQSDLPVAYKPAKKEPATKIKPLVKISIAAAAVLLIGSALLLNISTAKAVTLEGIYKAIEKIKNVHISSFTPDKKDPVQQRWVSRTLNVNMIKTDKESVLWDITNKVKRTKHYNLSESTDLSTQETAEIQNTITESLGLLPFNSISDIPKDAQWSRITDRTQEDIEVYELIWIEKIYEGHSTFKEWRFFIDPETNLPQRVEVYQKADEVSEYSLKYVKIVKYLNDTEMQAIIKEASF
jgi:hypothetical protein